MSNANDGAKSCVSLLNLPAELFSDIIDSLVSDDLDIALSSRIISKRFNEEIIASVVRLGALEPQDGKTIPYSSTPFLSTYLFRRTLADPLRHHRFSKAIGSILDEILEKNPEDEEKREEYLHKLCHATIRVREPVVNEVPQSPPHSILPGHLFGTAMQLIMAASAVLDLKSIFRECVERGTESRPTFLGQPLKLVAEKGDLDSINLLSDGSPDSRLAKHNIWIGAIHGVAMQHDIDIMQSALGLKPVFARNQDRAEWLDFRDLLVKSVAAGQIQMTQFLVKRLCSIAPFEQRKFFRRCEPRFPNGPGSPDVYWYNFALWEAAPRGKLYIVRWTIENGAEVNHPVSGHWPRGGTLLDAAARSGSLPLVNLLIQKGATASLGPQGAGAISFLRAVGEGWLDIVRIYVGFGYDPNVELSPQGRFRGGYPLVIAVKRGKVACVQLLIELGLTVSVTEEPGKGAHELAVSRGYTSIARLIEAS